MSFVRLLDLMIRLSSLALATSSGGDCNARIAEFHVGS